MTFCSKCGNKLGKNEDFCSKCGNKINNSKNEIETPNKFLPITYILLSSIFLLIFIFTLITSFSDYENSHLPLIYRAISMLILFISIPYFIYNLYKKYFNKFSLYLSVVGILTISISLFNLSQINDIGFFLILSAIPPISLLYLSIKTYIEK